MGCRLHGLGAGLTGLGAAFWAQKAGKQVILLEKKESIGGVVHSIRQDGYTLDLGANTAAYTPLIQELVRELKLENDIQFAKQSANVRYLCRDKQLHKVYPSPKFLLSTRLLSRKGKWKLLREPWRNSKSPIGESVATFFTRRLGPEAYTYLLEPVLGGIYAGNPEKMSMAAVMPKLLEWETHYGSLFKGMIASRKQAQAKGEPIRRIFSFSEGMQQLPLRMAHSLGSAIHTQAEVIGIQRTEGGYEVRYRQLEEEKSIRSPQLIWTLPAYRGDLLLNLAPGLAERLLSMPYVPMQMMHLAYRSTEIGRLRDGFGFLVPKVESEALLGAIWNSSIFPGRAPEGEELFTLFVGGGRKTVENKQETQQLYQEAQALFEELMQIRALPVFRHIHHWKQAIPQYGLHHLSVREEIRQMEEAHPGLIVTGNFRNGVSVGDCLEAGRTAGLTPFLACS